MLLINSLLFGKGVLCLKVLYYNDLIVSWVQTYISVTNLPSNMVSIVEKIIKFLTKILLIPVSFCDDGEYNFKLLSVRNLLCLILYAIIPSSLMVYTLFEDILLIIQQDFGSYSFAKGSALALQIFIQAEDIFLLFLIPVSLGNLFQKCKDLLTEKMRNPKRYFELIVLGIINVMFLSFWIKEGSVKTRIFFSFGYFIYSLQFNIQTLIVNTLTSTFLRQCHKLTSTTNAKLLVLETEILVDVFNKLKEGLGPILLYNYINSMANLTHFAFQQTSNSNVSFFFVILFMSIIIWNLSSCCQECYEELQSTKAVLR